MLCSCIDVIKIALGTNDNRKICYTLMYLEENVTEGLLFLYRTAALLPDWSFLTGRYTG